MREERKHYVQSTRPPIKGATAGICDKLATWVKDPFHDRGHWSWRPEKKKRKPKKKKDTKEQRKALVKSLMDDLGL